MFGTPIPEGSTALPETRQFQEWVTGDGSPTILGASSPSATSLKQQNKVMNRRSRVLIRRPCS
eukprot:5819248-Lingulodinium_polyedra.AAC.1